MSCESGSVFESVWIRSVVAELLKKTKVTSYLWVTCEFIRVPSLSQQGKQLYYALMADSFWMFQSLVVALRPIRSSRDKVAAWTSFDLAPSPYRGHFESPFQILPKNALKIVWLEFPKVKYFGNNLKIPPKNDFMTRQTKTCCLICFEFVVQIDFKLFSNWCFRTHLLHYYFYISFCGR